MTSKSQDFQSPIRVSSRIKTSSTKFNVFITFFLFKILYLFYITFANNYVSDHKPDAFDYIINHYFDGFVKWDARYFYFIAQNGYVYEHLLAFFPIFPLLIKTFDIFNNLILTGIFFNIFLNYFTLLILQRISLFVSIYQLSHTKVLLWFFVINPATIFYTTLYSESLYMFLSFLAFYLISKSYQKHNYLFTLLSALLVGFSIGTRFIGVFNVIYLAHSLLYQLLYDFLEKNKLTFWNLIKFLILSLLCIIFVMGPLVMYNAYAHSTFCLPQNHHLIKDFGKTKGYFGQHKPVEQIADIVKYGIGQNYKLSPNLIEAYNKINTTFKPLNNSYSEPDWCSSKYNMLYKMLMPHFYFNIQREYWDVGFLHYIKWRKAPCFALALPILMYLVLSIKFAISCVLKSLSLNTSNILRKFIWNPLFPAIIHGVLLLYTLVFMSHIEISTRVVCSSFPFLYVYLAQTFNARFLKLFDKSEEYDSHKSNAQTLLQNISFVNFLKLLYRIMPFYFWYATFFILIGSALHVNFYPWT